MSLSQKVHPPTTQRLLDPRGAMVIDRQLAFAICIMGIVLVILVIACMEIYIQRSRIQQSRGESTENDRPLDTVRRKQ